MNPELDSEHVDEISGAIQVATADLWNDLVFSRYYASEHGSHHLRALGSALIIAALCNEILRRDPLSLGSGTAFEQYEYGAAALVVRHTVPFDIKNAEVLRSELCQAYEPLTESWRATPPTDLVAAAAEWQCWSLAPAPTSGAVAPPDLLVAAAYRLHTVSGGQSITVLDEQRHLVTPHNRF